MADTTLTQTGAEVQADLDKVEGLANIKTIGSGLSLSAGGELSASGSGNGLQGYSVIIASTATTTNARYKVVYLDNELKIHALDIEKTLLPYTINNVYCFLSIGIYNPGWSGAPNYFKISNVNDIVYVSGYEIDSLGTGDGSNQFVSDGHYYVQANTTITYNYVGGGGGN